MQTRLSAVTAIVSLLAATTQADLVIRVENASFTPDGTNPTVMTVPIVIQVRQGTTANPGDEVESWDIQKLDFTNFTGTISDVTVTNIAEGNLFAGFPTFFSAPTASRPITMGAVVTSSGPPFPTLIDGAVLAHLTLSIAGGEQGSFDIVLDGIDGLGEFGIFDGDPNGYPNVLVQGATIQVIPEPSALFCFAGISSLMGFRNITRRFLRK